MNAQLVLYVAALVVFLLGLFDFPQFGTTRCIALGLALVTLAQLVR
jgi:hypothetical protein